MSRVLLVVPPLTGHVNPTAGLACALTQRGHEVAWACAESFIRPLAGQDATVFGTGMRLFRPQQTRGLAALRSLWTEFVVPFARFTLPAVERAALAFRPDVIAVDQHALAGAIVARRLGLPWASLAFTAMELNDPYRALPQVDAWIRGHCATLAAQAGLSSDDSFDPRFSPHLVIASTTAALTGAAVFPDHFALVGPMLAGRPDGPAFPWEFLDPRRRHVAVTMGTLAGDLTGDFHARAAAALAPLGQRLQAIVVTQPPTRPEPPPHVLVRPQVPLLALMPRLDAVICHGGLNTASEALAHGLPLVLAPIRHDQPTVAAQVAAAGAGIRVSFTRASAGQLTEALMAVLEDPAYRTAADRVRDSFAAAGGAQAAARRMELLCEGN